MKNSQYNIKSCVWELTLKCNMNCLHCGSRAGRKRSNELSIIEALNVADQLIDLGCEHVSLIGGEVFLYKNWQEIAKKLSSHHVTVNVISNGYLFGDKQINEIKEAGLSNLALSIDGMEAQHNTIRGNPKSFDSIKKTIEKLNDENIPIAVNTTLIDSNVSDLNELHQFLESNNVKVWQLQLANPMGNLSDHNELIISLENIKKVSAFIREKREVSSMKIYTGDNIGYYGEHERYIRGAPGDISYWSGCQAGLTTLGIDSIGNIKGCESLYDDVFIEGNIRKNSISEIWNKEGNFAYNRNFDKKLLTGKCAECDMGAFCKAGCRGACFFTKGSYFENAYCTYNT